MLMYPLLAYSESGCGIPMPGRTCGRSGESLSVTPSMSSVMSQIRKHVSCEDEVLEADEEMLWSNGMKRKLSEETAGTASTLGSEDSHPLAYGPEGDEPAEQPMFRGVSMVDLDLESEWTVDDIVQSYKPVYERHVRRRSVDLAIGGARSTSNQMFYSDKVELEQWPSAVESPSGGGVQELVLPNRRTRQRSLNPNFFKLYSMEISGKNKRLLPDISVDEQVLNQLSYSEIRALDIQPSITDEGDVSPDDIKLALITRKKLWSDMTHDQRQDLFGDSVPWNLKFVSCGDQSQETKESSLVRVESELKPWLVGSSRFHHSMLKPCGKLQLGASANAKEIQYVVKGWCDKRFAQ